MSSNPLEVGHQVQAGGAGGGAGRSSMVKNRAAAAIQISAEQLLREAKERVDAPGGPSAGPKVEIEDQEELDHFRLEKRSQFEGSLRRQPQLMGTWLKYAAFEEAQQDYRRMRSVFERALDVTHKDVKVWLRYAETETRCGFVNHARNVWDRAVTLLPRVDQLWFKYAYMEESLGRVDAARAIFQRWMEWEPDDHGWTSFVRLEERAGQWERARGVFERYVDCHPTLKAYARWAKWEERQANVAGARRVFERALDELPVEEQTEALFEQFAEFESRQREFERARAIYRFALDALTPEQRESAAGRQLLAAWTKFEKRFGSRAGIEDVLLQKRRAEYEEAVAAAPLNYDAWFDYARLEEAAGELDRARAVYERAVACVPPVPEKQYWRRYIYLWIYYAVFEELDCDDAERARAVYAACLAVVPHERFTFGKVWVLAAQLEVRARDVPAAARLLGQAIGRCPKDSLFRKYVALQMQLGNVDACRRLYAKWIAFRPANCAAWCAFAGLEQALNEEARCRAIFEQAVAQPAMETPERLWRAYIDFEVAAARHERARALYARLLERTQHVKVHISFALFEADAAGPAAARERFQAAYDALKQHSDVKEDRVLLLNAWLDYEAGLPPADARADDVRAKMPRKIPKKRLLTAEDGSEAGWEEYYDYLFPDDEQQASGLRILEMAQAWKAGRA